MLVQAGDGEHFLDALKDAPRHAMPVLIETPGQIAQQELGLVGVTEFPGLAQRPTGRRPERLGQAFQDIARLVDLTALDRRMLAESVADGAGERLGAVTMNRRLSAVSGR